MIIFHDISHWQGSYDMNDGCPLIAIKIGGGDAGLYFDSKASVNYINAKNNGKVVVGYWFAGGTDPIAEADKFIKGMSPLAENDILALDWEVGNPDPVGWCTQFVNHVHDSIGVWPLIYMNTSTCNAHDWSPVLQNCGLWIADYRYTPDQTVPCHHPYLIHQYTSTPLDTDALFTDLDTLKKYGWHAPQAPAPAPAPTPVPEPTPIPAPVVAPVVSPPTTTTVSVPSATVTTTTSPSTVTISVPQPKPVPVVNKPVTHWYDFLLALLRALHLIK